MTMAFVTGRGDRSIACFKFNSLRWLQPCLVGIRGSIGSGSCGHNSGTAFVATAVSAGAATTDVRGGVGLCSCAVIVTIAVSAGAATVGVRGGVGLCSCTASVIALVTVAATKSESWNTYMVNDHRPAFLKSLTILDGCRFSVRHIQNFEDLPC